MNTHYFVTNRFIDDDNNIDNKGKQPAQDELRFAVYHFKDLEDDGNYEVLPELDEQMEQAIFENPNDLELRKELASEKVFAGTHTNMLDADHSKGDVLFYIHGYNCSFDDSLELIRILHDRYVKDPDSPIKQIVAFCWPSNGRLREYRDDARDAAESGKTLGRLYNKLAGWFKRQYIYGSFKECNQNIHLLAHSMGHQVLESMVGSLMNQGVKPKSFFKEAVCIGADVDYDAFEPHKPLYNLIDFCQRVYIYYHNKDAALTVSENTKNALNRLGKWGCKNSTHIPDDVYQCDITDVADDLGNSREKWFNHWSYYASSQVVDDIQSVFLGAPSVYHI